MWKNIFLFVLGMFTATMIVWALPNTCDMARNTVQGAITSAPGFLDSVRSWTTGE